MAITTGNFAKVLWPGVNSFYGIAYKEHNTEYTDIFETRSSRKSYEEIVGTSGLGLAAVKPEGEPVAYDNMRQGYTNRFTNITYGLGFIVTREMVDDDLYDVIMQQRARGLAQSMRKTKETVGANILNNATSGSYLGGDGVSLLSSAHPNVAGGTWSNQLGTAADLSEAALEQACIDMGNWEDDRGLKIAAMPKRLIINVNDQFNAERILMTDLRVGTADNDLNAIKSMGKIPQGFRVNHYLTDTDAWFLTTDVPDGLIHFERRADDFTMDNDFDTENAKYKATGRYTFGWADPRGVFGSIGA